MYEIGTIGRWESVTEAARSNDFPMVRWLVEQGADITLVDKYGDRPYPLSWTAPYSDAVLERQESLACGSLTRSRSECPTWSLWEATRMNTAFS